MILGAMNNIFHMNTFIDINAIPGAENKVVLPRRTVETCRDVVSLGHVVVCTRGARIGERVTLLRLAIVSGWTGDRPGGIEGTVESLGARLADDLPRLVLKLPHWAWRGLA